MTTSSSSNVSFLENFVDSIAGLPMDIAKNLSLMRELDQKCSEIVCDCESKAKVFKQSSSSSSSTDTTLSEEIRKQMETAIDLSEEKVELSKQCYDIVDRTIRKLDDQLAKFAQLLSQEKNATFMPPATAQSATFSTDSTNLKHNEKHVINVNTNETRSQALKNAAALKAPAFAGTTRATRLMSSSDLLSDASMISGEEYDAILDKEAPAPDKKEKQPKKETAAQKSRSRAEEERDHADVFHANNTITTQETPKLIVKLKSNSNNKEKVPTKQTKKSTKKRSRNQKDSEGPPTQKRKLSADDKKGVPVKVTAPKPVKDKEVKKDHAVVSATHAGMMSIASFNKGKGEPMGGKGQLIGLKGAALASMTNSKKKSAKSTKPDILAADLPVDPNEPIYCYCRQVSFGEMVACDNEGCAREWFHFPCVGLTAAPTGTWYCPECRVLKAKEAHTRKK